MHPTYSRIIRTQMSSLARYFGLGDQTHRSLDDARMTLEVLKSCATVSLLDDILKETSRLTPSDTSCGESDPSDITTLISKTHIGTDEAKTGRHQDESTPPPDPHYKKYRRLQLGFIIFFSFFVTPRSAVQNSRTNSTVEICSLDTHAKMNLYERDGHNEPSDTSNSSRKKNMKRLGGGGLSLQTFANLKSKNSHYNPAFIKKQKEFYKNAKYVSKFRKSMKQHDKEVKLQSFREEDETGDSSRVVGDDDKRKGKSHKRIGVDEVYKQTREVMEKARMEREAALQAKREAKEEAESLRRVAKGKMMRKTRHGQPVMKYRIEHLLESIKKSAENDGSRTA
ncbi:unnamed protein product [Brassica napus]|uniref:(rape) hypothetical protein n=2 Tax=Brassica napus TaxID=3708 RepID=A0A816I8H8_BRANA|nr:unnamed protein product [Brassica napus]